MNGSMESLALGLLRTTLVTSIAVLVVMWLLWVLRIRSPRLHRAAWLLVLAQGWLLVPFTWQMEVEAPVQVAPGSTVIATPFTETMTVAITPVPVIETVEPFDVVTFVSRWSLVVWLAGIALLVAVGTWRYLKLFAAGRPGEIATEREWLDEWKQVREPSRLRTPVELRTTRRLGPLVCWVPWVFLVLVPRGLWRSLTRADRLAILRHELAHCERGDLWKNLAVRLLALPQWFNPLVWRAVARFEEAGEWACDDRVAAGSSSVDYAKILVRIADQPSRLPSGAVGMASGVLSRRVQRLLQYPNKEVREMRGFILPVLLVVVGLLQVVRIERVAAEEAEAQTSAAATPESNPGQEDKMPAYIIEPPDVITVTIADVVHKSPRKIQQGDLLLYRYTGPVFLHSPLRETHLDLQDTLLPVSSDGNITFGNECQFYAEGMTIEEAETILRNLLQLKHPSRGTTFAMEFAIDAEILNGKHVVRPDGKVHFGNYGSVNVNGLTLGEAKDAIEKHLAKWLVDPKVTVNIHANNSKKYYIVTKRYGRGDDVVTGPITGNETVMDAIATIGGLEGEAKIWVERTTGDGKDHLVKPVNYEAITKGGDPSTNHKLLPKDRLFIEYPLNSARMVGVGVSSNAGIVGEILLAEKERSEGAPKTSATYSDPDAAERSLKKSDLNLRKSDLVRYRLGLITDPKQNLRAAELPKEGPIMIGESSVMMRMLRVLDKNELIRLFDGRLTVTPLDGELAVGEEQASGKSMTFNIKQGTVKAKDVHLFGEAATTSPQATDNKLRWEFTVCRNTDGPVIEVRAKLSTETNPQQLEIAMLLDEGRSCLLRFPGEGDDAEAGDAYLLISRERVE